MRQGSHFGTTDSKKEGKIEVALQIFLINFIQHTLILDDWTPVRGRLDADSWTTGRDYHVEI
jgi:hypothetical protein